MMNHTDSCLFLIVVERTSAVMRKGPPRLDTLGLFIWAEPLLGVVPFKDGALTKGAIRVLVYGCAANYVSSPRCVNFPTGKVTLQSGTLRVYCSIQASVSEPRRSSCPTSSPSPPAASPAPPSSSPSPPCPHFHQRCRHRHWHHLQQSRHLTRIVSSRSSISASSSSSASFPSQHQLLSLWFLLSNGILH